MGRIIENHILFPELIQDLAEVKKAMLPSDYFKFGFLDADEDLQQLIDEDAQTLMRHGITHDWIALKIEKLFAADSIEVNGNPIVGKYYIHTPKCPWGDFCSCSPLDYVPRVTELFVCNAEKCPQYVYDHLVKHQGISVDDFEDIVGNDWVMILSDLHPHMIREHHFFEGKKNPYRVDPERVMRYLGIK